jgi:hypothetical protein
MALCGDRLWFQSCRLPEWSLEVRRIISISSAGHRATTVNITIAAFCRARRLSPRRIEPGKLFLFAFDKTGVPPGDGCLQPVSSRDFHELPFVVAAFALYREVDVERGARSGVKWL